MDAEFPLLRIAPDQRILGKIGNRIAEVIHSNAAHRNREQEIRYRLRRQPGESLQETASRKAYLVDRRLPGYRNGTRIFGDLFIGPIDDLGPVLEPQLVIASEAERAPRDVGASLFER